MIQDFVNGYELPWVARVRKLRREIGLGKKVLVNVECSLVKRLRKVSDILLRQLVFFWLKERNT